MTCYHGASISVAGMERSMVEADQFVRAMTPYEITVGAYFGRGKQWGEFIIVVGLGR